MLGSQTRQISGTVSWLAQVPGGGITGINDYRLIGDTASLADLHLRPGYAHGRWVHGIARFGTQVHALSAVGGGCHYAVVQSADVPPSTRSLFDCGGVFTTPTSINGAHPPGSATGALNMVWRAGRLELHGHLEVRVEGDAARLAIIQYGVLPGAICRGGSPIGGSHYELVLALDGRGMLRCVVLYRAQFARGALYQGVAVFDADGS
jgi:hypothetical protein